MYNEAFVSEVGARSRFVQEHLTGGSNEVFESPPEVASFLCLQSDGILSSLTPSNKSHHHMTNIYFNIFKFLFSVHVTSDVEKLCSGMAIVVASLDSMANTHCTFLGNDIAACTTGERSRNLSRTLIVAYSTLFSNFSSLHRERLVAMTFKRNSLGNWGSANHF